MKVRKGKGFTKDELKAAGVSMKKALSIGISMDHRRRNHCEESLKENTDRLKEYLSKLIIAPRKSKAKKGDTSKDKLKNVKQNTLKTVLPIKKAALREKAREITAEEKAQSVYRIMRKARQVKRGVGREIKRAKAKAEKEKNK